jgi:hypothetical protein
MSNILISGTNNALTLDLQSFPTPPSTLSCVVELNSVHINGLLTWKARTSADSIEVWTCQLLGGLALSGGAGIFTNSYIPAPVVYNTVGTGSPSGIDFMNCYVDSSFDVQEAGGFAITSKLAACFISGTLTGHPSTAGTVVTADCSSTGSGYTGWNVAGSAALFQGLGIYVPATLANWNNDPPTSIQNALDRIAAKITPIMASADPPQPPETTHITIIED